MKKGKKAGNIQKNLFKTEIPQMPEGYYSGDKPNPNLRAFVEKHIKERPYDPEADDYDVPAFVKPIETTKATAIYNMHTYWSKKPHDAMRQYIMHYTKPGDLVLDPFCGLGGTALAALMEGRKAIAIDRSPAATFIAKNYCTPVDVNELQQAFQELKDKIKPEIDWLYETRCDRCGGNATTAHTVYSQVFQCPRCMEKVPLFDCVKVDGRTAAGKSKKINACPHCDKKGIVEEISTRGDKFGEIPVLVSYICENGCKPARGHRLYNDHSEKERQYFEKFDLRKLRKIEKQSIPQWYPSLLMIKGRETCVKRNLAGQGVNTVADLYTKRNLWALASLLNGIRSIKFLQDVLLFTFTSILLKSSRMMAHNSDGIGRIQKGTYYIPQLIHDVNVWRFMEEGIGDMVHGYLAIDGLKPRLMISTSDSRFMDIGKNTIDYIFTDPSYADKVQYGELNFVWEAWLNFDTNWHDDEIVVNEVWGRTQSDWALMLKTALLECYRILKPGRSISLCYHDTSEGTWGLVQDIMAEVGFIAEKTAFALFIDTKTKTTNQYFADKVTKRDLVINFRKPLPNELKAEVIITGEEDETTFNDKVKLIISEYLVANPGSTKDRIYDEVVSRMVRAGHMEPHDFDSILSQVAEGVVTPVMKNLFEQKDPDLFGGHEIRRWYLKEIEISEQDEAETLKEDKAFQMMVDFMKDFSEKNPEQDGVHYSDLFEHYVYRVTDKPRRQLADFLPDYFFKTDSGTWRLPVSEDEERLKAEGRSKGTLRRIKRYVSFIEQNLPVPEKERPNDATIAEWIRHCKRSGLYEQGKLLYEKGGLNLENLTEEDQVYLEEDYDTCVRYLSRGR